jgi:AraC-like DNA-binding protein
MAGVIESFSTRTVAPAERLDYWNRVAAESSAGLSIDSASPSFDGQLKVWRLGEITLLRPRAETSVVHRAVRAGEERLIVNVQHRGASRQRLGAIEAELKPGDLSVCTTAAPTRLDVLSHEMVSLEFARSRLEARVPNLEAYLGRPVLSSSPATHSFGQFLFGLWREAESATDPFDDVWQTSAESILLDLLALSLRSRVVPPIDQRGLARVKALIERRIGDPDLSAGAIAQELGVSARTVQHWFAAMATTPRAYILRRRLERAAERLALGESESVTTAAFDHGFNDAAHFARCFRERFGATPSAWRAAARN